MDPGQGSRLRSKLNASSGVGLGDPVNFAYKHAIKHLQTPRRDHEGCNQREQMHWLVETDSRDLPEPEPIGPEDMRPLRTVRGEIILAMKTVR